MLVLFLFPYCIWLHCIELRGMFGSTFEMHFLNYESQKGKKKSQKVGHQKKLKKNLFFYKVLNEN